LETVPARPARASAHRNGAALPPPRAHQGRGDIMGEPRSPLVAACEDRRPLPRSIPWRSSRGRDHSRHALRPRRRARAGRARSRRSSHRPRLL